MAEKLIRDFVILFATIDPVGTLSIFLALTVHLSAKEKRRVAIRAITYATVILIAFVVVGQIVLTLMEIRLAAFAVAGGIILFLFGVQMIFGSGPTDPSSMTEDHDVAVFPLAVPSLASPGAILAITLLTDNDQFDIATQLGTTLMMVAVMLFTLMVLLVADRIHRVIGDQGAQILVRLLGMMLAALAVEMIFEGAQELAEQWPS